MPIRRLLTGSSFVPESVSVITHAYDAALLELKIGPDDEKAKTRLAKLVLQVASPMTELDADDLVDRVTTAWGWRNPRVDRS
jgi:hypothetical protein